MEVYKIEYKENRFATRPNRTYIIAEVSEAFALALAFAQETMHYGMVYKPSLEAFKCEEIKGVFAKKAGIKARYE